MKIGDQAFTLMEIIIVVVILGFLAVVAFPKFLSHQESGNATNAISILMSLRQEQLVYRIEYGNYTNDCSTLDVKVAIPQGFSDPVCSTTDPIVKITRTDDYTLTLTADGAFTCSGGTKCSYVNKVLPK